MKKQLLPFIISAMLGASSIGYAQQTGTTPEGFKYQASLRNMHGEVIADKLVSIRISILSKGSNLKGGNTEQVYSEIHTVSTNKLGMVSFEIGNGRNETGDFSAINWGSTEHYVQIEMDEAGGDNYKVLGTSQLMAVPYSLHAKMASDVMPGSITIQNEIAARKEADEVLQSQVNIIRTMLENTAGVKGNDGVLGVSQDLETLKNRYEADSAAKNTRINNNLTRFKNDSVALRNLIATEVSRAQAAEAVLQTNLDIEAADRITDVNNEENRATTAEADLRTQITNLNSSTNASVATETARAQAAETELVNGLAAEVARATAEEATLDGKVTTEKNRAEGIEGGLRNDLTAETSRATAAEQTNAAAITAEAATARAAETELASDIATAATNAVAAIDGVQSNLDAEIARASVAEQENANAITNETTRATNAETTLEAAITNETSTARAAEASLGNDITTASANAAAAIASVQNSLDAETARASAAEQANATAITNETNRATDAEATLANSISVETARATAAEQANAADIATEASRAVAVESGHDTRISNLESETANQAAINSSLETAIISEAARAQAAESALEATSGSKWDNTGNAGTDASANFIGTTDEQDFVAKTNNTERLRVTSSGQTKVSGPVEINTTSGALTLPRLTEAERDALTPTPGMTIYNTTANKFQGYSAGSGGNETLDQSNTTLWEAIHITEVGQSFTSGATGTLSKLGLNIMYVNTPGDYTLKIKSSASDMPFYSQTVSINTGGEQLIEITGTVDIMSGTVYTFWFEPIGDSYAVSHLSENSYPGGSMYVWPYNDYNTGYDLHFKTYITATMGWQDMTGAGVASGGETVDLSILWGKNGNAGTDAFSDFIGTTDEVDLVAKTNNTERLRITSQGQVEINSTTGSLLLPRLSTEQRNALSPVAGMIIYNTTTNKFQGVSVAGLQESLDQSNSSQWSGIHLNEFGQSFTAGSTGKLTKLGLDVYYVNTPGDWVLKIKNTSDNEPFYTQTITINEGGDQTFTMSGDVNLTGGNVYTFWCEPVGNSYAVLHLTENTYAGGDLYYWPGKQHYTNMYDVNFKTYISAITAGWQDMSGAASNSGGPTDGGGSNTSFVLPKMTSAQRDALTPEPGMQIFNTTSMRFQGYGAGTGGTEALDQSNTVEWDGGGFNDAGQSFTAGTTGTLTKVSANIYYVNQPGDYILKIKNGTTENNTPFYTQTVTVTNGGENEFVLTGEVGVESGQQYTMWFEPVGNSYAVMHISNGDSYTGGDMYYAPYNSFSPGYDWNFKTYIAPVVLGWQNLH